MVKSYMEKVNTIFIGTSEFAVPILEELLELEYIYIKAVITQPDKPAGRKQELLSSPVKHFAVKNNLNAELLQPERIKIEAESILEKFKPDLIIVASYGQIIPKKILNYPKFKCLNFHGSLLPELRGAVPIQMSILKGLKKTGVTLQRMVFKMDEGPIISKREINLNGRETSESLTKTLADLSKTILTEDLSKWIDCKIKEVPQDGDKATYCFKEDINKDRAEVTRNHSVSEAGRMVRAFNPWPIAWLVIPEGNYKGKRLKIFEIEEVDQKIEQNLTNESMLVEVDGQLRLKLKDGDIILKEVQLEGKEKRDGSEYLYLVK